MFWSSMEESVDTQVMISINSCGWSESVGVFILISRKKTTFQDMDTELIIWSFPLCKTVLCINSVTIVLGKLILNMENPKVMIMLEMQILDTKTLNCITSLKPLLHNVGSCVSTREIKEPIEKLLNLSKLVTTSATCLRRPFQATCLSNIVIQRNQHNDTSTWIHLNVF